jgi:tetratricopeptide (TPR) repeat protein
MAYAVLGQVESNLGEKKVGSEYTKKAYELRDRASEPEKFYIESHYYENVTGDSEQAVQVYLLWAQTYPQDSVPHNNLAVAYTQLGQWQKALPEALDAHRLAPEESISYMVVGATYLGLGRFDEAKAILNDALSRKLEVPNFHRVLYLIAFAQNDQPAAAHELSILSNSAPDVAAAALALAAPSEAYFGHLAKARALSQRAIADAQSLGKKESAGYALASLAGIEAEAEDSASARKDAAAALSIDSSIRTRSEAAYAFARAGDSARAESLVGEMAKERPSDTVGNMIVLPTIRADAELGRNNPGKAVEILQPVIPYDLAIFGRVLSAYGRGRAFLLLHQGNEAAAEFQKALDHPGVVLNSVVGPLAHLQLGRAYMLAGDEAKARAAYQDFFALWKDADPDIPILKQAKAEYAKFK